MIWWFLGERRGVSSERNKKCLKTNETHLMRNKTKGGNLLLSGTVGKTAKRSFFKKRFSITFFSSALCMNLILFSNKDCCRNSMK